MKDKKGYLKRLEGSMQEKLFFVEHLDLNNKIIVDFGCANAALIKHLMAMGFENTTYIGIERDEDFFNECIKLQEQNSNFKVFSDINEADLFIRTERVCRKDTRKVILICSSVLHEVTEKMFKWIIGWAHANADYLVIRDMYWDFNSCIIDEDDDEEYMKLFLYKVYVHKLLSNPTYIPYLSDFARKRGSFTDMDLCEFLLKYRYIKNWDTEVEERYFSVDWYSIEHRHDSYVIYRNEYTNDFIKRQVKEDFDINIHWPTHKQLILKIAKSWEDYFEDEQ